MTTNSNQTPGSEVVAPPTAPAPEAHTITMYGLTKLLNQAGEKALGTKWAHVREQHMYNYKANGQIKNTVQGRITRSQADEFVKGFVNRRVAKLNTSA